jgi:glycosyltransferase involved in cell wall biosynthesis
VAKDEEQNISRCIESILSSTKTIESREILLVDSCSSDKTVEIAKQYPINIVQLGENWPHSPSAGRFTGVNNTNGKYVLIIDGDMELQKGWVEVVLKFMEETPKAAALVGKYYELFLQKNGDYSKPKLAMNCKGRSKFGKIDYIFGSSIFRRKSLLEAGNFHPYLRAEEEAEISYRLTKNGYNLFFFPYDAIYHYSIPRNTLQETIRRIRRNLCAGMGDMMSWSLRNRYYLIIWKRFKVHILFLSFMLFSVVGTICFAFLNKPLFSAIFSLMPFAFVLLICIKKKSIQQGALSVLNTSVVSINLVGGLFRKIDNISNYPTGVIWIKRI